MDASEPFPTPPIRILYRAGAGGGIIAASLMTAAICWAVSATASGKHHLVFSYAAAALGAILGIAGVLVGARLAWKPPLGLIVDRDGIVTNPQKPDSRILWSDIKGAHLSEQIHRSAYLLVPTTRTKIVALELVDPDAFYDRRATFGPRWSGYGITRDYFPLRCGNLDIDADKLVYIVNHGVEQNSRP
jgi:hypothetical protein